MLSNIEQESAGDARRILALLCTAKRPLTVEELIDAVAVDLGDDPRFNEDSRLMSADDIRHICPGFIEMDVRQRGKGNATIVRIAHYSVQEYLESDRIRASRMAEFGVNRVDSNTEAALICLAYLLQQELCEECINQAPAFYTKYPLALYAARNWPDHYRGGNSSDPRLDRLALQLFHDDRVALVSWASLFEWYNPYELESRTPSPLSFAARLGLDHIIGVLADDSASRPLRGHELELAMITAANYGWATTVELLLNHGANINYLMSEGTALHLASSNNHFEVVETLVDHGAAIDILDYSNKSPMYRAWSNGNLRMMQLLLSRGANPTSMSGHWLMPLESAAYGGDVKMMEGFLDDFGADINRGHSRTPLESAVMGGRVESVAFLLDRGARVEEAGEYWRLVKDALARRNIDMVEVLLNRGAAILAEGTSSEQLLRHPGARVLAAIGCTPLERAAFVEDGSLDLVKILLDHGADPNEGVEMSPLEAAVTGLFMDRAELLLDRGADVNRGVKKTPWQAARQLGYHELAEFLVNRGAYVSEENGTARLEET